MSSVAETSRQKHKVPSAISASSSDSVPRRAGPGAGGGVGRKACAVTMGGALETGPTARGTPASVGGGGSGDDEGGLDGASDGASSAGGP